MFFKVGAPKTFVKFTTLLKRNTNKWVFRQNLWNLWEHLFVSNWTLVAGTAYRNSWILKKRFTRFQQLCSTLVEIVHDNIFKFSSNFWLIIMKLRDIMSHKQINFSPTVLRIFRFTFIEPYLQWSIQNPVKHLI